MTAPVTTQKDINYFPAMRKIQRPLLERQVVTFSTPARTTNFNKVVQYKMPITKEVAKEMKIRIENKKEY